MSTHVPAKVVPIPRNYRNSDALITPGTYDARLVGAETAVFFFGRAPRVVLWYQICTFGEAFEAIVPGYYAVKSITGKPRWMGGFTIGSKSKLARDLAAMLGRRAPLTFIPMDEIATKLYSVVVETVERDFEQHSIPSGARYSRVSRVLGIAK